MTLSDALRQTKTLTVFAKGSIKTAESMISKDEHIFFAAVVNITIEPTTRPLEVDLLKTRGKLNGVLVVTSRRILFCNNVLGQGTTKQISMSDIQSIDDARTMLQAAKVRIAGLSEMFVVDATAQLASNLWSALNNARAAKQPQEATTPSIQKSMADELIDLKNLVDLGVITQDDFDKKKNQLLGI